MRRARLIWRIFPPLLALTLAAMLSVAWYAARVFTEYHYTELQADLRSTVLLAAEQLQRLPDPLTDADTDALCKALGATSGRRVTLILWDGEVIGDSDHAPRSMDNHADRPEIVAAQRTGFGSSVRRSDTLRQSLMYAAVPVTLPDRRSAVLRVSRPVADVERALGRILTRIGVMLAVLLAVGALVGLLVSRAISQPLKDLTHGAARFARGDFSLMLPAARVEEIDALSDTLNRMARQLDERLTTVTRQRDEQNALLSCMVEGVLAVDMDRGLIRVNRSAAELLHIDLEASQRRAIAEVVRNADLLKIIDRTLESPEPVEGEIYLPDGDRYLQAHGTVLHGADEESIGALIVMNDVTRLRKLETVRRDFVANVSHELKTPITSVKGFAETLLETRPQDPADLERFLEIIVRQADRLQSILEDLLVLSSIEYDTDKSGIERRPTRLARVIDNAIRATQAQAAAKQIAVDKTVPPDLQVPANMQLLEQAVINLLDNAIKYSDPGTRVAVTVDAGAREVAIHIKDNGPGIAKRHLPRLFERFYRVDKSRSRKLGGTGLGLAIVKRVAIAHHGRVDVSSRVDEGSTFSILLPRENGTLPSRSLDSSAPDHD